MTSNARRGGGRTRPRRTEGFAGSTSHSTGDPEPSVCEPRRSGVHLQYSRRSLWARTSVMSGSSSRPVTSSSRQQVISGQQVRGTTAVVPLTVVAGWNLWHRHCRVTGSCDEPPTGGVASSGTSSRPMPLAVPDWESLERSSAGLSGQVPPGSRDDDYCSTDHLLPLVAGREPQAELGRQHLVGPWPRARAPGSPVGPCRAAPLRCAALSGT